MSAKKILVVDDSLTSLMWQRMILGEERYNVVTAQDGQQGLDAALSERPDLILMDAAMPNMNGFDACRALRANGTTKHVPVIIVTMPSRADDVEKGYASGCSDCITKPIDRAELLTKVKAHLGQ